MAASWSTPSSGPAAPPLEPVDMTRFREFAEVARFFRIEAEDRLPGASRPKGAGVTDSGQAETAGRIYGAILDGAARRYREAPGRGPADVRLVFDPRLAERLAAWSIRWARAGSARPGPCFAVQRGPVAHRADGGTGGRPIAPRGPRASRPARRRTRRSVASPRIRRRRAVLPPGSPVGAGADQGAMKTVGRRSSSPWGEEVFSEEEDCRISRPPLPRRRPPGDGGGSPP